MMRTRSFILPLLLASAAASAQERRNWFDDPFVQVTSAIPGCPVPRPPGMTEAEFRAAEHVRAQHGTSCYHSGRCRLPNSYLYDKEIIPRVAQYIRRDGRFDDTSVWVLGERRIVTLMGCVKTKEQAEQLQRSVGLVDDVMNVVDFLMVGTQGKPKYETVP
ncbi:BON domain-containing protein [Ramlibacter sp.]|uniref:BON domain-containing protein n=1 Tax=Ramlibacter sp. TaxID=1917967 RepID=UPI002D806741|nr:BON domain-containing protein [Ramlibacter sp.]